MHYGTFRIGCCVGSVSRYNNMMPFGKRSGKTLKGFPSHNDGMPGCYGLKSFKIVWQMP